MTPPSLLFRIASKLVSLYVRIRHAGVPPGYRYYYRNTYLCKLVQFKYVVADFIRRKPYKMIGFDGEFGPDLQFALPHAYWHYKNGTLKATQSTKFMGEFYYFSPEHTATFDRRTTEGNYNYDLPRTLYSHDYDMSKWTPVPLKEIYRNDVYVYEKPILIIANRYNQEWDGPPVSFLSVEVIDFIIRSLKDRYTIIYNRPKLAQIVMDNSDFHDLGEFDWLRREHPEVLLMEDLFQANRGNARNYNHFQLQLYANAERFISTHGGTSVLASYFGGINLILSKKGPEHHFNCYQTLYPQLSGATILHAKTDEEVKQYVQSHFAGAGQPASATALVS
ncbi:hypothetical protein [Spirosoma sordidisoli]|uniref:hypothetical protein n=1 Tax=Spirosoma sordidisoli TaxID=2502893 RepID=UPI001F0D5B9F|nr:hypothetical protein [Spirosoma sordidisoli]